MSALSATTRLGGVVGDPVGHSLSPTLHNAAYAALGLDFAYGAFAVPDGALPRAVAGALALGFFGLSVTTPHKQAAARCAHQVSGRVEQLGVANTLVMATGVVAADSTDGAGLLADLRSAVGFDPSGQVCAVLGAGGAGAAVVLALAEAGAKAVPIVNRSPRRAEAAASLAPGVASVAPPEAVADAALVVNATSLGLSHDAAAADAGRRLGALVAAGQLAVDLVYEPATTPFLLEAKRRGARTRNGLGMLVHQAALQVELFTGTPAPTEAMWAAVASRATS